MLAQFLDLCLSVLGFFTGPIAIGFIVTAIIQQPRELSDWCRRVYGGWR